MSAEKANLADISSIRVRDAFQHRGCDISENEL